MYFELLFAATKMGLYASEKKSMWEGSLLEAMLVNTVLVAHNSLALLLLATGSVINDINMASKLTAVTGRFPFEELLKLKKPCAENKDASDTEDDEDDDEDDDDVNDQDDEEGGDEDFSGEEGEDEGGDPEDDPEANGNGGSDDDDEDDDDEDDDGDDDEDEDGEEEDEDEEEEVPQPPAKRRK